MNSTKRISVKRAEGSILLVEDDTLVARSLERILVAEGYGVEIVGTVSAAVDASMSGAFDVVISDLNLPGGSGIDALSIVRAYEPDLPFVIISGAPSVENAIEAVNLGALEFLVKPVNRETLLRVVTRAMEKSRSSVELSEIPPATQPIVQSIAQIAGPSSLNEESIVSGIKKIGSTNIVVDMTSANSIPVNELARTEPPRAPVILHVPEDAPDQRGIETVRPIDPALDRAFASLAINLEPIYDARHRSIIGYESRMTSAEESLSTQAAIVAAADDAGRLPVVRRRARDLAVKAFSDVVGSSAKLFVDVYPSDLLDTDLYSPEAPLSRIAESVVLQLRGMGTPLEDLLARVAVLRFLGFKIAIADLDAATSRLSLAAELGPEYVKLDASLVRGIDSSPPRQKLVAGLVTTFGALGATCIAEGVTSAAERESLLHSGCYVAQGVLPANVGSAASSIRRPLASGIVSNGRAVGGSVNAKTRRLMAASG